MNLHRGLQMRTVTRKDFLKAAAAFGGASCMRRFAAANPLGLPIGLQPYTVRNDLKDDFAGTLKKIAAMGYQEIEVSGGEEYGVFYGHKPAELRKILDDAGLRVPSCHFGAPKDAAGWDQCIADAHQLGLKYMLSTTRSEWKTSLDGWKRTAALFNHLAEKSRQAGIGFAYHNHNFEYKVYDGVTGYDELLQSSDKDLVKMEMDCFWTTFAGKDPVAYFHQYPGRFPLLHIKDLKQDYPPTTGRFEGNPFTEVGNGVIDWKRIFRAAPEAGVQHYFIEQDMWDRPSLESAQISIDYLKKLTV
jgi:sugar phosphate isomerase/epimerase